MNDSSRWACAALGLRIKWIALWVLLISPLLVLVGSLVGMPILWATGAALFASFLVDAAGRLCGLATPTVRRWPILLSAAAQSSGLVVAAALVILLYDDSYSIAIGVSLAALALIFAQVVAAYLFTVYLADVAERLGEPQWAERSNQLRSKISKNIAAASGMTSVAIMLGMLTLIAGVVTCGIGFYIFLPLDALVLLGFMPLWIPIVWQMFGEYGRILSHLQQRIRYRSVSPFQGDDDKVVFLPIDQPPK